VIERRPYQRPGAEFLASRRHAILGDQPGLGKTLQAIDAADLVGAETVVVVCPASVRPHWQREFAKGSSREWRAQVVETQTAQLNPNANLIVVSYPLVRAPAILEQLKARRLDALILDEAQNLRGPTSQQTRAVYGPGCAGTGLIAHAGHCWGLSGTIAPNGWARELHPHLRAFGLTSLTAQGFDHRYHVLRETRWGFTPVAHRNMEELRELLAGIYLRRTIDEVAPDLPALTITTTPIEADKSALMIAEAVPALADLRARSPPVVMGKPSNCSSAPAATPWRGCDTAPACSRSPEPSP
jgi:SWI/SNF-related matrix-associated actin-dependent regulator of chromatin subfamily A-like protein 1